MYFIGVCNTKVALLDSLNKARVINACQACFVFDFIYLDLTDHCHASYAITNCNVHAYVYQSHKRVNKYYCIYSIISLTNTVKPV